MHLITAHSPLSLDRLSHVLGLLQLPLVPCTMQGRTRSEMKGQIRCTGVRRIHLRMYRGVKVMRTTSPQRCGASCMIFLESDRLG
ncbi:hypothetical protein SERLA73DRAFT_175529 [Serpula lacrymans var. lacrymans S7.3]|uniref:Uncharacterized protein n=1 Tax=Serpula lacrymans var. lacrymans (strain S7.3) TaxID=936435 RepID=F8PKD6_SERL3|nr:hypothetical protein SERLA73DRAFT_175529 [Serpula lacrymans var. lacrymans S7.3]